mgnify:FL=1
MLYGGIRINDSQSCIVILDESNKLFIPHDIIIDNTAIAIKNFINSMQQGGIAPAAICFAINPAQVKSSAAFKSFTELFAQAGYELRIINMANDKYNPIVVTKSRGADETTTALALYLKKHFSDSDIFLDADYRLIYYYYGINHYFCFILLHIAVFGNCLISFHIFNLWNLPVILGIIASLGVPLMHSYRCNQLAKAKHPAFILSKHGIQYCVANNYLGPTKLKQALFYPWSSVYKIEQNKPIFSSRSYDNDVTYLLYIRNQPTLTLNFWEINRTADENLNILKLYKDLFGE